MHPKTSPVKVYLTLCLAAITTFLFTSLSFAREPIHTVTGKVTKVSDGDTIQVTTPEKTKLRVRFYGIHLNMVQEGYAEAYIENLKEPYRSQFVRAERKRDPQR